MSWKNLISQEDAAELIGSPNVTFVDGSWYLPAQNRNAYEEFQAARVPSAVFFDIDAISDQTTDLPHMLPSPEQFAEQVGKLGISDTDHIVIYDGLGLFSAPRVWWTFKIMGAKNVSIIEGGFDHWRSDDRPIETGRPKDIQAASFTPSFTSEQVASQKDLIENLTSNQCLVLDARPAPRFEGTAPEPRQGLRSGHIPGSASVPASDLISAGTLKPIAELAPIIENAGVKQGTPLITSCGSGVTAAIIALALDELGYDEVRLYDGSWAQWGLPEGPEIAI